MASLLNMSGGSLLGKGGLLPSGYKQLEYIENISNAYIDTGYVPYGGCILAGKMQIVDNRFWIFIGSHNWESDRDFNSNGYNRCYILIRHDTGRCQYAKGNTYNNNGPNIGTNVCEFYLDFIGTNYKVIVNNQTLNNSVTKDYTLKSKHPIIIFGKPDDPSTPPTSSYGPSCGLVYSCTIYNTYNVLVRDFIPCIAPDKTVGMYDTVEGNFYSSPNGTAFIAGPEV